MLIPMPRLQFDVELHGVDTEEEFIRYLGETLKPTLSRFQLGRVNQLAIDLGNENGPLSIAALEDLIGCMAHVLDSDHKFASMISSWINTHGPL